MLSNLDSARFWQDKTVIFRVSAVPLLAGTKRNEAPIRCLTKNGLFWPTLATPRTKRSSSGGCCVPAVSLLAGTKRNEVPIRCLNKERFVLTDTRHEFSVLATSFCQSTTTQALDVLQIPYIRWTCLSPRGNLSCSGERNQCLSTEAWLASASATIS